MTPWLSCAPTGPSSSRCSYAANRAGLRLTPINWHLTGDEAGYIVENCEAKAFVAAADLGRHARGRRAGRPPGPGAGRGRRAFPGSSAYGDLLGGEDGSDVDDPVPGTQMLYTSGTTGRPKGVHRDSAPPSALAMVNFCGYDESYETSIDAHLVHRTPLPRRAARLLGRRPSPLRRAHRGHGALGARRDAPPRRGAPHHPHPHGADDVPPAARAARRRAVRATTISSLRFVIHGAAPCPVPVKQRIIEWLGPIVVEYYAATEGLGTIVDSADLAAAPGHRRAPDGARTGQDRRRGRQRDAHRRGRPGLPPRARPPPGSTTTAIPTRRPAPSGASTSPSATWATSTRTASCS